MLARVIQCMRSLINYHYIATRCCDFDLTTKKKAVFFLITYFSPSLCDLTENIWVYWTWPCKVVCGKRRLNWNAMNYASRFVNEISSIVIFLYAIHTHIYDSSINNTKSVYQLLFSVLSLPLTQMPSSSSVHVRSNH